MNREGQFEVEIKARDTYKHYVVVRQPGDTVYWTFATRKKNIGFGLYYLLDNPDQPGKAPPPSQAPRTLSNSVSVESLALVRKNSQLLSKMAAETALSGEHIREILRCAMPLVHISPPPKQQAGLGRSGSVDGGNMESLAALRDRANISSTDMLANEPDDDSMIALVPAEKYSSAETTITGSLDAPLAGTYVLIFDNSFSINTSKQLTLCVSVRRGGEAHAPQPQQFPQQLPATVVRGGWMLKRKRLRMQGFSKKWFKLDSTGLLTYHDDPDGPVRSGLNVRMCVITKVPPRLLITLDSGTELFHLKALTETDYRQWCDKISMVIQSFLAETADASSNQASADRESRSETLILQNRILEHRISCASAMEDLKEAGEREQDVVISKYLARLEKTFASLNAFYNDLLTLEKALTSPAAAASAMHSPVVKLPMPEDDVFYDVIIMSDISDEESVIGELDRSMAEHLTVPSGEPSIAPSEEDADAEHMVVQQLAAGAQLVRLALPARASPINVTYAQMLGRLSSRNATTPVILNEPLSLLQRQCEELEYCELLNAACRASDPVDRISLVAAFAVSCYSNCIYRYEYKPFTPMLGETFEWIDSARGFRFISEKVEHRPETILACHAESLDGKWVFWQELQVKTKNWGKTAELTPGGLSHVSLATENGNRLEYKWNKVTSCVRNILSRDIFIDNFGEMVVTAVDPAAPPLYAKIEFAKSASEGMWGSLSTATRTGRNEISGIVVQGRKAAARLSGRWDDYLAVEERVLWKAAPPPVNSRDYYGFSLFAMQLNVPVARQLRGSAGPPAPPPPPTDSRLRPDQRLVEEGHIDSADLEKARLEQKQRAERSAREERGEEWRPLWFERSHGEYRFTDAYFEKRQGDFKDIEFPNLFF